MVTRQDQMRRLNSPSMQMGNVGGSVPMGDVGGMLYGEGADPSSQVQQGVQDPNYPWMAALLAARTHGLASNDQNRGGGLMDDWMDMYKLGIPPGGKGSVIAGGPSAPGSNQLRGVPTQMGDAFSGLMAARRGGR